MSTAPKANTAATTNVDGVELKNPRLAALLAWVFPGLGHFYQDRWLKGSVFSLLVCGCFFYGWWLGDFKNVYFSWDRYSYFGQLFAGLLTLPATLQALFGPYVPLLGDLQAMPSDEQLDAVYREAAALFEIGTLYTTVAGLLNVLVICDAHGGPVYGRAPESTASETTADDDAVPTEA